MMHTHLTRSATQREGAATVELAILAPLIVFLLVVAVDFARIFFYTVSIQSAVEDGAIYACESTARASNSSKIESLVLADLTDIIPTPTVSSTHGYDAEGDHYVEVSARYTFKTITNFPGVPSSVNVVRICRMPIKVERPRDPNSAN